MWMKPASVLETEKMLEKENGEIRKESTIRKYNELKNNTEHIGISDVLALPFGHIGKSTLLELSDKFRSESTSGSAIFAGINENEEPFFVVAVTDDLVKKGIKAGDIANTAASVVGGRGGGRPDLAQAGGKDASKIDEALEKAKEFVKNKLQ